MGFEPEITHECNDGARAVLMIALVFCTLFMNLVIRHHINSRTVGGELLCSVTYGGWLPRAEPAGGVSRSPAPTSTARPFERRITRHQTFKRNQLSTRYSEIQSECSTYLYYCVCLC